MFKYSIFIRYCNIDNIFVASVPELEGCSAHGDTPEEAMEEIKIAMGLWLEVAEEVGKEIPKPKTFAEYDGMNILKAV